MNPTWSAGQERARYAGADGSLFRPAQKRFAPLFLAREFSSQGGLCSDPVCWREQLQSVTGEATRWCCSVVLPRQRAQGQAPGGRSERRSRGQASRRRWFAEAPRALAGWHGELLGSRCGGGGATATGHWSSAALNVKRSHAAALAKQEGDHANKPLSIDDTLAGPSQVPSRRWSPLGVDRRDSLVLCSIGCDALH